MQSVSDNEAVVVVLNLGYARDGVLTHLLQFLSFIAASFSFWYSTCHIPGRLNVAADAISRNILHVCDFCGDEVCREFFGEPNSSPHEVSGS